MRARQQRNFLTTLLLSQGVPMIAHGDELGRGQSGNNNVYCQDNELAWVEWGLQDWQRDLLAFSRRVVDLRTSHPVFRRRRFFDRGSGGGAGGEVGDIAWFTPTGDAMTDEGWSQGSARSLMVFLNGDAIRDPDRRGGRVVGDSFLVVFNAHDKPITCTVPGAAYGGGWLVALDTSDDQIGIVSVFDDATTLVPGVEFTVTDRSIVVLRRPVAEGP
ncbi:MAG TPA: hypothetical protein VFD59_06770 [Nocardioidaceae bacterium]|nr:hypothetical protein [Nocardioidaceae bacterium]